VVLWTIPTIRAVAFDLAAAPPQLARYSSLPAHLALAAPAAYTTPRVLHSHTRAVTDVHWSPFQPDVLASSSLDGNVLVWDLRQTGRANAATSMRAPAIGGALSSPSPASSVLWCPSSPWLIAAGHATGFAVWDIRRGCTPLVAGSGAATGPYTNSGPRPVSIDWHPQLETEIMAAGSDGILRIHAADRPTDAPRLVDAGAGQLGLAKYTPVTSLGQVGVLVVPLAFDQPAKLIPWPSAVRRNVESADVPGTDEPKVEVARGRRIRGLYGTAVAVEWRGGWTATDSLAADGIHLSPVPSDVPMDPSAEECDWHAVAWTAARELRV
ncbi:WD40-repeat-containing domain protein, partial [Blastocladiella britannica]